GAALGCPPPLAADGEARQRRRRLRARDGRRQLPRLADDTAGSDAAVDEPDAIRLRCIDGLARQDHLQCPCPSDEPGQSTRAPETRAEAERQLREAEAGARPADAQVAGKGDLEPATEAESIHG